MIIEIHGFPHLSKINHLHFHIRKRPLPHLTRSDFNRTVKVCHQPEYHFTGSTKFHVILKSNVKSESFETFVLDCKKKIVHHFGIAYVE